MVNAKLIEYIKTEQAQGYQAHQLHDFLVKKGFLDSEVQEAIEYANKKDITTSEQQRGFEQALPHIRRRNSVLTFLLALFTLNIYGAIWYVLTVVELKKHQQQAPSPYYGLLLITPQLLFVFFLFNLRSHHFLYLLIPLLVLISHLIVFRPYTKSLTRLTGGNSGILLSLLILAPPFGVLATQEELNSRAHYK